MKFTLNSNLTMGLVSCFLCACTGNNTATNSNAQEKPAFKIITAEAAHEMMQKPDKYVLLDVRTPEEFQEKHIPGAINIPNQEIGQRAKTELTDKNAVLLVYCKAGGRAASASKTLAEMGYLNVFNFGGIQDWPYETVIGK